MKAFVRRPFAALLIVAALAAPAAADKTFAVGSLIIPPGAAYQTDCGAVAIYGLVYNVLRANAYLKTKPLISPGGEIELYYAFNGNKASPNRCAPTNKSTTPAPLGDARWVDGCDFEIYNNTATPVSLVNNNGGADTNVVTVDTTGAAAGANPRVWPGYASQTVSFATGFNKVRYLGAPFIIDSTDAATFLGLLRGTIIANDKADGTGNNIDFSPFRTVGACSFGTTIGGYVNVHRSNTIFTAPAPKAFTTAPPRVALLATRQAGVSAIALRYQTFNISGTSSPGASKSGTLITFRTTANHGLAVGDVVRTTGVSNGSYNGTWTVNSIVDTRRFTVNTGSLLPLGSSGNGTLTKSGARKTGNIIYLITTADHGLVAGNDAVIEDVSIPGYNATWTITSAPTARTLTINTGVATGLAPSFSGGDITKVIPGAATKRVDDGILQVYLQNAGLEFPGAGGCPPGGINVGDASKCPLGGVRGQIYDTFDFGDFATGKLDSNYKMVWTPHWATYGTSTASPTAAEIATIATIATFLDGQTGLMAECHSIEAFEGADNNGSAHERGAPAGQFMTCKNDGSGACAATTTYFGVNKDIPALSENTYWQNCSDPNQANGADCVYFADPGDPFAQPGDHTWYTKSGSVSNFINNTTEGSIYRPGVLPLISGVTTLDKTKLAPADARASLVVTDYVTRHNKDNTPTKANILYMSGHDVSGVVSGTKVILQTLLLLGEPPIETSNTEVSRSSPITATVTTPTGVKTALIQGSFEKLNPPATTLTTNTDGPTVAAFRYPDVFGHMRAMEAASVTAQTDFKDTSVIFDAATVLPTAPCDSSNLYGSGTGGCRTVWTNTAAGAHPANVVFNTAASSNSALKTAINIDGGFGTGSIDADFGLFLSRIVAGYEVTPGTFEPRLGGVDRSSVAAVGSSLVAGVSRPKVVYFGASDGMLHAVCASIVAGTGCDVLGRELWAYIPRLQLPLLRRNLAKVEGSPRVMDVYGDFAGTGTKSFRTILMFQTGTGDPATVGIMPSVVALDITNPFAPTVVWDFSVANPSVRGPFEPGHGLVLSGGPVRIGGAFKNFAFIQTNNGGTSGVGNVVTAVDMDNGQAVWEHGIAYPITGIGRDGSAPLASAMPGGAVGVDKQGTGGITDVVFGTLYGEMYLVDAASGLSRQDAPAVSPGTPLFRFTGDRHPFGASPTIYSNGGQLYAIGVSGGYHDLSNTMTWSDPDQMAVAVSLSVPTTSSPVNEGSGTPSVPWTKAFDAGDKAFAQAIVVGGDVFITTDSLDINDNSLTGYGAGAADTGKVYHLNTSNGSDVQTAVVVRGGAGSVNTNGTDVYSVSKDKAQKLATGAQSTTGESPGSIAQAKITRLLWLRTL
jgi:hypothetical protein